MNIINTNPQMIFDVMDKAYKFATIMSKSDLIPTHYRNKPENCFIAINSAIRSGIDPLLAMQNTYVVNGKLGMTAPFAISMLNQSGLIKGAISYKVEGSGENLVVTASAKLAKTDQEISTSVSMKTAIADGWTRNAKYKTMPEHMLKYRAATFLIRLHFPEVLNGLQTTEELEDVSGVTEVKDVTTYNTKSEKIASKISAAINEPEQPIKTKEELIAELQNLVTNSVIDEGLDKLCNKCGLTSILEMDINQLRMAIEWAKQKQEITNE